MEFHPLISLDPVQLSDLLIEERRDWLAALNWDPSDAQRLLLKYIGLHMLPGYAAVEGGRVVGYTYYLTREQVGLLGTLYVSSSHRRPKVVLELLEKTLDCMRSFSSLARIEAQIFPFGVDLVSAFSHFGFQLYRRQYMEKDLRNYMPAAASAPAQSNITFQIIPWGSRLLESSAMIIQAGYTDSIDREICCEYATYESCLTFLRNLNSNPGCGTFLPQASFMAVDRAQRPSGVVLASRLSTSTALIAQVSVLPGYQGYGLGARLMAQALAHLKDLGFSEVCLSVSERNERAYAWYRRLGFRPRKELLAFVWQR